MHFSHQVSIKSMWFNKAKQVETNIMFEAVEMTDSGSEFIIATTIFCLMFVLLLWQSSKKDDSTKKQVASSAMLSFFLFGLKIEVKSANQGAMNVIEAVKATYPGALDNSTLAKKVVPALEKYGYNKNNTLVATSLCCDEVNRELEKEFAKVYGDNFSMGGLAGFPFCGKTSFGAMAHHIPEDGSCLIIYGPHVGIDFDGIVGKVNRRGRHGSGACCGSATAAAGYVKGVKSGAIKPFDVPQSTEDAQQVWVSNLLLPHADRLLSAKNEAAELPLCLFKSQDEMMQKIVSAMCGEVAGVGKIALLGGIQINTPEGVSDFFLPLKFEVKNNKGMTMENLLKSW